MNDALNDKKKRGLTYFCYALLVASPFLLLAVISLVIGRNAFAAQPVWSNELDLWRSLFSWDAVGFTKGYSGLCEALPSVGTLGVTGITPIMLYGLFVKLFGLSSSTILLANACWISLAALVFCLLVKPTRAIALTLFGLLALYTPLTMYCFTSMTEPFDFALMLFYLAFLTRYYRKRGVGMLILCLVTLAVGCVLRGLYMVLLIPIVLAYSEFKPTFKALCLTVGSTILALGCIVLASRVTAPTVLKFSYHFLRAESPELMWRMLLSHGKVNLLSYFSSTGSAVQDAFRVLYWLVSALCLLGSFLRVKREDGRLRASFHFDIELFCCLGLLMFAFGCVIAFFEVGDWADFRALSPILWLVLGFLTVHRRPFIPALSLAACAVVTVVLLTLPYEGAFTEAQRFDIEPDSERVTHAAEAIVYDPDATNPLTNTVRTDLSTMQVQRELHPGLGLQYGWFTNETTGRSYWILTDQLKCPVEGYELVYHEPKMNVYRLVTPYEVD